MSPTIRKKWRRERDSNPRCLATSLVFKTSSINHSNISPRVGNWSVPRRNLRLSKYNKSPNKSQSPFARIKNIFLSRRKFRKGRRKATPAPPAARKNSAISIKDGKCAVSDMVFAGGQSRDRIRVSTSLAAAVRSAAELYSPQEWQLFMPQATTTPRTP